MRLRHDLAGRVVGLTGRDGTELSVELDELDRPVAITDGARRVEQTFDRAGRLVGRSVDGRGHRWERHGRRLDVLAPDGTTTSYERDAAGRVIGISHPVVGDATVTRDRAGRPLRLVAPALDRRWWWDEQGLLERMDQSVGDRTTSVTVTRDGSGRIVGLDDARGSTRFAYDDAGQLVKLTTPDDGVRTFAYEHGRRVTEVAPDGTMRRFRYDAAGQLVAIEGPDGVTRLAYDELGRRIERLGPDGTTVHYGWSGRNQLADITTTLPGAHSGATIRLAADPTGDLVAVDGIDLDWDHTTGMPTVARVGDRAIIGPGTPLAVTTSPDGDEQLTGQATEGASAEAPRGQAASDAWLGRDVFGTPWLDDAVATSVGLAAGTAVDLAGPLGLGTHGELTIDGLVWLRMRVYDPDTATFLSPDPLPPVLGGGQVANPYHYAANNPIGAIDPWGLQPLTDAELAAFNDRASRGLGTRISDGAANFVDDPIGWAADNWEGIATGVLVVAGGIMIATGVGAPIGIGLIAGATLSMGGQIAMTGEVDGRATFISTVGGGVSGGMGGLFASASVPVQIGVGAGTDAVVSAGSQYAMNGTVDPWAVGLDSLIGGTSSAAGAWLHNARSPSIGEAVDGIPAAAIADDLSSRGVRPLPGTRVRPEGLPGNWRISPTRSPGGTRYLRSSESRQRCPGDAGKSGNCLSCLPTSVRTMATQRSTSELRWYSVGKGKRPRGTHSFGLVPVQPGGIRQMKPELHAIARDALAELADERWQRAVWTGRSPEWMSTAEECLSRLWDDSDLARNLERPDTVVYSEVVDEELRALQLLSSRIDIDEPAIHIVEMPVMAQVRDIARRVLREPAFNA